MNNPPLIYAIPFLSFLKNIFKVQFVLLDVRHEDPVTFPRLLHDDDLHITAVVKALSCR